MIMQLILGFFIGYIYASVGVVAMVYLSSFVAEVDRLVGDTAWRAFVCVLVWPLLLVWVMALAAKRRIFNKPSW